MTTQEIIDELVSGMSDMRAATTRLNHAMHTENESLTTTEVYRLAKVLVGVLRQGIRPPGIP